MKRFSKTTIAIVCCLSWQAASAQSIEQILKQHYPRHSAQNQCWLGKSVRYYSDDKPVSGDYCFTIDTQQTVNSAEGKLHYILLIGQGIDLKTGEWQTAHVDSGAVGMLVLKARANGGWQTVAANTGIPVGAYGQAPKDWALHAFGPSPGAWGFIAESGDMHQGYAGRSYVILLPQGNKISRSEITAELDNSGALGDCGADMGFESAAEQQDCRRRRETLTGRLNIDHGGTPVAGFYPLQLTINGFSGTRQYRNHVVRIPFNPAKQQYLAPKSSPLSGAAY